MPFDPLQQEPLIQKAWASKRDPLYLPGNFNNRILIEITGVKDPRKMSAFIEAVRALPETRAERDGDETGPFDWSRS